MPLVIAIVVALVIVLGYGYLNTFKKDRTVVAPNPDACSCDALLDMVNRLALIKVAMQSIDALSNAQSGKDAQEMYSDKVYAQGKAANEDAISKAKTGAPPHGGETLPSDCSPIIPKEASTCIQAALRAHENVHQRECLAFNSRVRNYKYAKTMVEFWKEDREGYEEEAKFLNDQKAKCMRGNYIGPETKEEQQQRLAGSKRRVSKYVAGLS